MGSFREWCETEDSLIVEVGELASDPGMSFEDKGGVIAVSHPSFQRVKKGQSPGAFGNYFLLFRPSNEGRGIKAYSADFPGDGSMISNRNDADFWQNMNKNFIVLTKLITGALAKFLTEYRPGMIDCSRLNKVFDEFRPHMGSVNSARGMTTADSGMRLAVSMANRSLPPEQAYAMAGTTIVSRQANRLKSQTSANYVPNMQANKKEYDTDLDKQRQVKAQYRSGIVSANQEADDAFGQWNTPRQRSSEDTDSYAARLLRR